MVLNPKMNLTNLVEQKIDSNKQRRKLQNNKTQQDTKTLNVRISVIVYIQDTQSSNHCKEYMNTQLHRSK